MEIGTWEGKRARKMITIAQSTASKTQEVEYFGFDLFEEMDDKTFAHEIAKRPPTLNTIQQKLEKTGAKINLFKGNTNQSLPINIPKLPMMDFVFIDGGHSIETIDNDWTYVQQIMDEKTVVIFDDYWNKTDQGAKPLIDSLNRKMWNVEIIQPTDKFKKPWGILQINLVKVMKK
jgi:hypothetical protein